MARTGAACVALTAVLALVNGAWGQANSTISFANPQAAVPSCGSTSPYVGFNGLLTTLDHKVGGMVTIIDDCTFQVAMFTYDGMGPATFWAGAPTLADLTAAKAVTVLNGQQLTQAYNGTKTITVPLLSGVTWQDIGVISAWCTEFKADFGHVVLAAKASTPAGSPSTSSCGKTSAYVGFNGLLTTLDHNVSGMLTIIDDCTFQVAMFTYDGMGPATFWSGAPSLADLTAAKDVTVLNGQQLTKAYTGTQTITVPLLAGVSWSDIGVVSAWCTEFKADFGHVVINAVKAATPAAAPACASTSPSVGFNGALVTLDHKVGGTVQIVSDCLFEVERFTYDGMGPATYWAGAPTLADLNAATNVVVINDQQLKQAYNGTETIAVPLAANVSLDTIGVISAWCTEFKADFGHVVLNSAAPAVAPAASPTSATPAAAPTTAAASNSSTAAAVPATAPVTAPAPAPSAAAWQLATLPIALVGSAALLGAAVL